MFKLLLLIFVAGALTSCSEDKVVEGKTRNPNGTYSKIKKINLDGWDIVTSDNGSFISLSRNGDSILYVTEDGFAIKEGFGRMITIESEGHGGGVLNLIDQNLDTTYEILELNTSDKRIIDHGLDGVFDTVVERNLNPIVANVNFEGVLYPLLGDGLKTGSIHVNGEEIKLKRDGFVWVPIEQEHNRKSNERDRSDEPSIR